MDFAEEAVRVCLRRWRYLQVHFPLDLANEVAEIRVHLPLEQSNLRIIIDS